MNEMRAVDGRKLLPYQAEGVEWLYPRSAAILGDEMGLGKTAQAICAAVKAGSERTVVVCPKATTLQWVSEISAWAGVESAVLSFAPPAKARPQAKWIIVPWSRLAQWAKKIEAAQILIVDEAHFAKTDSSRRTRALLAVAFLARKVWLLTGTPIPNRPRELRTLLLALDAHGKPPRVVRMARRKADWQRQFCDRKVLRLGHRRIVDDSGASNTSLLHALMSEVMLRRITAEVLPQLPELRQQVVVTSGRVSIPADWNRQAVYAALDKGKCPALPGLAEYRRELGEAKVPDAAHLVSQHGAGAVVFCHHRSVVGLLADELAVLGLLASTITGEDRPSARHETIRRFVSGRADVLIATIGSCGTGVDGIQARASTAVFAEIDWTPGVMAQAVGRLRRMGQTRPVLAQYLVTEDDLDRYVLSVLARKTTVLDTIVGGLL